MKIFLNGEEKILQNRQNILQLIQNLELDASKIAVEKDLEIVAPEDFDKVFLDEGAKIEIVHFIGGG